VSNLRVHVVMQTAVKKAQEWFALVTGFDLKLCDGVTEAEASIVVPKTARVVLRWFYSSEDVFGFLEETHGDPDLEMVMDAHHKDHHLIGTDDDCISVDTITGKPVVSSLFLVTLMDFSDVLRSQNISLLSPTSIPKEAEVIWWRWTYHQSQIIQLVSLLSSFPSVYR
jgi:hypothetical protein